MANCYSLGLRFELGQNGDCGWEFRTSALGSARITELAINAYAGSAQVSMGLGRPAARGIGPLSQALAPENPAEGASLSQIAVAWSGAAPTAPSNYLRRIVFNTTQTYKSFIASPQGIVVPAAASLGMFSVQGTLQAMLIDADCSARE